MNELTKQKTHLSNEQGFFWFLGVLSFFGFSQFFNHHFIQKTKKTLSFFSFFKVKTKKKQKNLGKTKKNQTWASDQTFSEKF